MTPVERLEAAIAKLERLKAASRPGPLSTEMLLGQGNDLLTAILSADMKVVGSTLREPDADLIVTLHHTIDAQLDLLRFARGFYGAQITGPESATAFAELALALADAINGGAS